ncbi:hypothetical protein vBVpaMR16F_160 [Vibrio phage vB_VpaM_R16F]|nr:hypothetical protein vBVpaMR16F_160 [Vibrio phage vB_VpaM_R16F]
MARGRGAPSKEQALKNKEERAKAKIIEQKIKSKELLADSYHEYMETLHKVATDTLGKEVSITNQVSTLKFLIGLADEVLKEEAKKDNSESETEKPAEPQAKANGTTGEVISLISTNYDED